MKETLPARATASHSSCEPGALVIDKAEPAALRLEPRDGDRFVLRQGAAGAIKVERAVSRRARASSLARADEINASLRLSGACQPKADAVGHRRLPDQKQDARSMMFRLPK